MVHALQVYGKAMAAKVLDLAAQLERVLQSSKELQARVDPLAAKEEQIRY